MQSGKPTITGVPYFIKGASVGATGITFSDGTTQTTAASASAHSSSFTYVPDSGNITGSSRFGKCVAGSSVTLTTGGTADIAIVYAGDVESGGNGVIVGLGALCDGNFCGNQSATKGITAEKTDANGADDTISMSFYYVIPSLGAGEHDFCLTSMSNSGFNHRVCSDLAETGTISSCRFGVIELK